MYAFIYDGYSDKGFHDDRGKDKEADADLAMIKTCNNEPDGKYFYYENELLDGFKIGPICLPAENVEITGIQIETVGWGIRYGEVVNKKDGPNKNDPVQRKHSCITNTYGPITQRKQHCDVHYLKIFGWSCDMGAKAEKTNKDSD